MKMEHFLDTVLNKLTINHINNINIWITEIYIVPLKPHKIKTMFPVVTVD